MRQPLLYSLLVVCTLALSGCTNPVSNGSSKGNDGAVATGVLTTELVQARFDASIGSLNLNRLGLPEMPDLCGLFSGYASKGVLNIDLSSNNIPVVSGDLSCFSELRSIDLSFNDITSFTTIGNVPGLKELIIHKNNLTSLGGITAFSGLSYLNIGFNAFEDLSGIANLPNLTTLIVYHNELKNLSGVEKLEKLKEIHVEYNNLADISFLKKMPLLKTITGSGKEQLPTTGSTASGSLSK